MHFSTLSHQKIACRTALASLVAFQLTVTAALAAVDLPLGEGRVIRFADVPQGVAAITARDDYIQRLSPFDRQVRPQTERAVSEEEFLAFLAQHVVPWTEQDIARIKPIVADIARKIEPFELPLPGVILLVKTTGGEEARAAYCRGPAIVLPQNIVNGGRLAQILPHELFHVLSNQNPDLRRALYATIGFQPTAEVSLPEALAPRKITNPDAPRNDSYVTVTHDGKQIELMPVLYANAPGYDASRGGNLFAYLTFRLMQLEEVDGRRGPLLVDGQPVLFDPADVPGYHEQIGANTKYIIHPEEVLADNFVFLLNGRRDLPTPRIVDAMAEVFRQEAANRPSL